MITLTTGLPGHGKSLYTIWYVKELAEREQRPVFYSGIKDLALPWIEIDPEKWFECPVGAIIVIDECQRIFRPRGSAAKVPDYVSKLETHRHDGHDIFLITQHPGLVDGNVRKLTERHMHVSRRFGMQRASVFEYQSCRDNPLRATADSIRREWKYPKEVFEYYKSSEMHTVKRRIPIQYAVMFLVPVLVIGLIYYFISSHYEDGKVVINKEQARNLAKFSGSPGSANSPGSSVPVVPAPGSSPKNESSPHMSVKEFIEVSNPRIPGLPHTAPKYDEVVRPVRAPYPAMCITFKSKCKCFTENGVYIETGDAVCYQVMEKGFYVDWNTNPSNGREAASVAQRPESVALPSEGLNVNNPNSLPVLPSAFRNPGVR